MQFTREELRQLVRHVVRRTVREMLTRLGPASVLVTPDGKRAIGDGGKPAALPPQDAADDGVPFYTVETLATRWEVDAKTVYAAIAAKQVPVVRLGQRVIRIPAAVVHEIEQGRVALPGGIHGHVSR